MSIEFVSELGVRSQKFYKYKDSGSSWDPDYFLEIILNLRMGFMHLSASSGLIYYYVEIIAVFTFDQ